MLNFNCVTQCFSLSLLTQIEIDIQHLDNLSSRKDVIFAHPNHGNQSAAMGGKSSSSGRPSIFACDLKTWWLYTYYFYIPTPLFRRFPYPFSSTPPRIENKAGRTFCCICATCHMYFDQHFRGSDMLTKKSEWTQWRMVMWLYGTMQQFAEQAYPYSLYDKKDWDRDVESAEDWKIA